MCRQKIDETPEQRKARYAEQKRVRYYEDAQRRQYHAEYYRYRVKNDPTFLADYREKNLMRYHIRKDPVLGIDPSIFV